MGGVTLEQGVGDHGGNTVRVAEHVMIPEAEEVVAFGFDQARAACVPLFSVLAAISFDH